MPCPRASVPNQNKPLSSLAIEDADTLAQAIETILDADETLGLLVQGTRLTRTEVDHDGDGDTPVLAARMTFEVSYWTKPMEVPDGLLPLQVLGLVVVYF